MSVLDFVKVVGKPLVLASVALGIEFTFLVTCFCCFKDLESSFKVNSVGGLVEK